MKCTIGVFLVAASLVSACSSVPRSLLDVPDPAPSHGALPAVTAENVSQTEFSETNVPILVYHLVESERPDPSPAQKWLTVSPATFKSQMGYLSANGYLTVDFDALYAHFTAGTSLPERAVILSFDDGWASQYRTAVPILRQYGFRATFFVVTDYIGHHDFMSWDELRELKAMGMAVESHTRSHPDLAKITNQESLNSEIKGSRDILEHQIGGTVDVIAYPYGLYNQRVISAVRTAGYHLARSVNRGLHNSTEDLFKLNVVIAPDSLSIFEHDVTKFNGD